MSFSFSVESGPASEFATAAQLAVDHYESLANPSDDTKESIAAAVAAAQAIVDSGCVGATVSASISGHANPEHKPTQGWANDCINISISNVDVLMVAVPDDAAAKDPASDDAADV